PWSVSYPLSHRSSLPPTKKAGPSAWRRRITYLGRSCRECSFTASCSTWRWLSRVGISTGDPPAAFRNGRAEPSTFILSGLRGGPALAARGLLIASRIACALGFLSISLTG